MSKLSPARKVTLDVLMEADRRGVYTRDVLSHRASVKALDHRDAAFASRLALGVTATEGTLDELLDRFLAKPKKVAPRVRMALRISAFEMLYLGTPGRVAVSQGVELVRANAKSAAGLANAVLRKVDDHLAEFRAASDVVTDDDRELRLIRLSRAYGIPIWLCGRLLDAFDGEDGQGLAFAGNLAPAPLAIHVNPRAQISKAVPDGLVDPVFPGCYAPVDAHAMIASGVFESAAAVASDLNAQLVATVATRPGSCLEIGAGRGTKTFVMACQALRAGFERTHYALDLHERKCDQNLHRLSRAGITGIRTIAGDACDLNETLTSLDARAGARVTFDTVFVDAPCSGTGTMRRHPEIPWRLTEQDVDQTLPLLQLAMLCEASRRVSAHGELIYATCSVMHQENLDVVHSFLASREGARFHLEPLSNATIFDLEQFGRARDIVRTREDTQGCFQSVPSSADSFDGHFAARLVRA